MTIRNVMIIVNTVIALVVLAFTCIFILGNIQEIQKATGAAQAAHIVGDIAGANVELSLERSITQVSLRLDDPINPDFAKMLSDQRTKSNSMFAAARQLILDSTALQDRLKYVDRLDSYLKTLDDLRADADRHMSLAITKRSADKIEKIPDQIKAVVSSIDRLLSDIRILIREAPPAVIATDLVVQRAFIIREYGGRERTLFAIAAAQKEPIKRDDLFYMKENNGRVLQAWGFLDPSRNSNLLSPDVKAAIGKLGIDYFDTYEKLRNAMYAASDTGNYPVDFAGFFQQSQQALGSAVALLQTAVASNQANIDDRLTDAWASLIQRGIMALLAAVLVGFAIWFSLLRVVRPIGQLSRAMDDIAAGNTSVEIPGAGRKDEIGAIARTLAVFQQATARIAALKDEETARELKIKAEKAALMNQLAEGFERSVGGIVSSVSSAATELADAARSLSASSEMTNRQSTTVATAANEASTNVQTVAAASEELTSSIKEIGRQVEQSSRIAGQAVQEAVETTVRVKELADAADRIGSIISLIRSIADRTNLLALNATIEAARAGEAGKGFAIVASEVKSLADQTARATAEIGVQVGAIQESTGSTAVAINSIAGTIRDINSIAASIAAAVEEQGAATSEIARNVQQAATGTGNVSSNIAEVTMSARAASESASRFLQSSGALSRQSDLLRQEVGRFLDSVRAA